MSRKKILLMVAVAVIVSMVSGIFFNKFFVENEPAVETLSFLQEPLQVEERYDVKTVRVLEGHVFDVLIDKGWIRANLAVTTPEQARKVVIDIFNNCSNPSIIVKKKIDSFPTIWIVEFMLTVDGKEVELTSLLDSKNLLFQ